MWEAACGRIVEVVAVYPDAASLYPGYVCGFCGRLLAGELGLLFKMGLSLAYPMHSLRSRGTLSKLVQYWGSHVKESLFL